MTVSNPLELTLAWMLKRLGPAPTAADEARWNREDAKTALRRDYVAKRSPDLFNAYARDSKRICEALHDIYPDQYPRIFALLAEGDDFEAVRLIRDAMTAKFADAATDDADEEAYACYPEE